MEQILHVKDFANLLESMRDGNRELLKRPLDAPDNVPLRYLVSAPGAAEYIRLLDPRPANIIHKQMNELRSFSYDISNRNDSLMDINVEAEYCLKVLSIWVVHRKFKPN